MIPAAEVPSLRADDQLVDALAALAGSDLNRAFVMDDGHLAGFLSITDLARAMEAPPPRRRR
jgi:CBS domain-containing protein